MSAPRTDNFEFGLVVDDHPEARAWMAKALADGFPGIAIQEAHDVASTLACLDQQLPDIAIIDLGLPDGSGIDLIRQLHQRHESAYKIVGTVLGDDRHLFESLRAGAQGYVLKDESTDELAKMLLGIVSGQPPLSASIARRLLTHFHAPQDSGSELTDREQEVLTLIAKGYSVKKAAELLQISNSTVASHVQNIYRKLNVSNRAEAALEATRRGLVTQQSN